MIEINTSDDDESIDGGGNVSSAVVKREECEGEEAAEKSRQLIESEGHRLVCPELNLKKKDLEACDLAMLKRTRLSSKETTEIETNRMQLGGFVCTDKSYIRMMSNGVIELELSCMIYINKYEYKRQINMSLSNSN